MTRASTPRLVDPETAHVAEERHEAAEYEVEVEMEGPGRYRRARAVGSPLASKLDWIYHLPLQAEGGYPAFCMVCEQAWPCATRQLGPAGVLPPNRPAPPRKAGPNQPIGDHT